MRVYFLSRKERGSSQNLRLIWLYGLFQFAVYLSAQEVSQPYVLSLQKAEKACLQSPELGIDMVKDVIADSKLNRNALEEGQAYILLGDIYEMNKQKDLALNRYRQALNILPKTEAANWIALTHYKRAKIFLDLKRSGDATLAFTECKNLAESPGLQIKCQEGLADATALTGNLDQSQQLYDVTRWYYQDQSDSLSLARLTAKQAKLDAFRGNLSQAQRSYSNSVQNLSPQFLSRQGYTTFEQVNEVLLDSIKNDRDKIALRLFNLNNKSRLKLPADLLLEEQLALANLYKSNGESNALQEALGEARELVGKSQNSAQRANFFQLSSEWYLDQGDLEGAKSDYQNYLAENARVFQEKEDALNRQLAIVRNQSTVDVAAKDVDLELKERELLENQMWTQRLIIIGLGLLLLAALISLLFIWRNVKARQKANDLLQLRSLRTQMNPHFIFNALNSVNNFISQSDERAANKFLSDFSKLMRMVLDHSQQDFISFEEEMQLLQLYLKLEQLRFRDKFSYTFTQDETLNKKVEIPPMLIQPFVENAVWHGLRYKEDMGLLEVHVADKEDHILVTVQDNGIGRERSKALKTKNQSQYRSTGLRNAQERIQLINQLYEKQYELSVEDAHEQGDVGTLITIKIPH
ncbi:MAG: histidine kinase [Saprospiraceae bacterium]|nr:histidine kinase [Saprospiraceae bacterium]